MENWQKSGTPMRWPFFWRSRQKSLCQRWRFFLFWRSGQKSLFQRWRFFFEIRWITGPTTLTRKCRPVAPGTKSGPGASSNMTDFRFCEVQNRRRKCCNLVRKLMWSSKKKKKKGLHRNFNGFSDRNKVISKKKGLQASHADFSMGPFSSAEANSLPEAHGPLAHCPPAPPLPEALV